MPPQPTIRLLAALVLLLLLLAPLPPTAHAFGFKLGDKKGGSKDSQDDAGSIDKPQQAPKGPAGAPPQVEVLTEANFWDRTGDGATWLVDFYAPWCGHCMRLNPLLDEVAPLVGAEHGLRIGKLDATQASKIAREFGVAGYPTLKVLQPGFEDATPDGEPAPGTVTDYEGPRSKEAFVALAERLAAPSPRRLSTPEELGSFQRAHPVAFLLALPHKDKGQEARVLEEAYRRVAHSLKASADFALIEGTGALKGKAEGAFRAPPFLAKTEQGEEPTHFPLDHFPPTVPEAEGAVRAWVAANNHPLVSKLESHNFRRLGSMGKLMAIAVVDPNDIKGSEAFVERLRKVGRAQQGLLQERFVLGHLDGSKWKSFVSQFGIQAHQLPRLFVLDFPSEQFYYDPAVNAADEMEAFLSAIAAGKVPAQRQGGFLQAASLIWSRLAEWYPWSLGLLFPLGILLALCFFPGALDSEEEALREPRREGEGGGGTAGEMGGAAGVKDAASKKDE